MRATVTFAFATFNAQESINQSLISALNQTHEPSEVLLYDDASTDNTVKIATKILSESSAPYKVICGLTNKGVGYSRKILVENCSSEYIAFFDDDDYSLPKRVATQLETIRHYEAMYQAEASPLCYSYRVVRSNLNLTFLCKSISIQASTVDMDKALLALLSCRPLPHPAKSGSSATCTLTCKTAILTNIGNFNPFFRRYEDLDVAVRAVKSGISLITVPEPLLVQNYSHTDFKSRAYKYNYRLIAYYKSAYPTPSDYKFAYLYIHFKNLVIQRKVRMSIKLLSILIIQYPCRLFPMVANSFSTFRFSPAVLLNQKKINP